jgi:hypothetical protein
MRRSVFVLSAVFAALLWRPAVPSARAQDAGQRELDRMCKDAPADQKEKCLVEHQGKVSNTCAMSRPALQQAAADSVPASCQGDVEKFCAGIAPSGGQIDACLKAHGADVSLQCQGERAGAEAVRARAVKAKREEALKRMRARQAETEAACSADVNRFCLDAKSKPGSAVADCLDQHKSELSSFCRDKFGAMPHPKHPKDRP